MSTFSDLPQEIMLDIFSRLPIKTLIRCKRVSKHCRRIITHPRFIKTHLEKSMQTNPKLILKSDSSSKFPYLDFETTVHKILTLDNKFSRKHEFLVVGSCNGLLCLSEFNMYISLWNPSLHEYFILPYDPIDPRTPADKSSTVVGFGYSPAKQKYKVVRFIHFFSVRKKFHLSEVKVYTVGMNWSSWKSVKIEQPYAFQNPNDAVLHLNGVLYWLNTNSKRSMDEVTNAVCFDIGSEQFHTWSCPEGNFGHNDLSLGVLQGYLCFSHRKRFECLDIWLMKDSCWTQLYTLRLPNTLQRRTFTDNYGESFEPLVFRKNGDLILKFGKRNVLLYNPVSDKFRHLSVQGIEDWSASFTYVEALTSLASLTGRACGENKQGNKGWAIFSYLFNFRYRSCYFIEQ